MDGIISFLKGIGEAITTAFDFLIGLFEDLIYIIQLLGKVIVSIPGYFSWLPAELVGLLIALFAIVVIYKVMGREG